MKVFSIRELIEAIKKDEIPWRTEDFFTSYGYDNGVKVVGAACALGVAAFNLEVDPNFENYDTDDEVWEKINSALNQLVEFNDSQAKSWDEIPPKAEELLSPFADIKMQAPEKKYRLVTNEELSARLG